jgi:DNA helicase-2/ATP-dependent DNA helicase PcrA
VPAAEIAVLYRINAQSEVYEQALTEAGIPYQVRGGEGFFQRPEVRQGVQALRQAARGDLPDARGADLVTLVRAALSRLGLTTAEPIGAQARERWSSLTALVQLTEELAGQDPELGLAGLLRELAARAEARHPPTLQGVTLASLHAAKGLEWDAVFLVGLADGTLPIAHVLGEGGAVADETALEEERRLLYVGVTRAREHLQLSWALARSEGWRKTRRRSRFLTGLVPEDSPASRIAQIGDRPGSARRHPICRVCGRPLLSAASTMLGRCSDCPAELDADLFAALREWRMTKAVEQSVPDYAVFTDATLTAIAEQRPTDTRALEAISGIRQKKLRQYGADVLAVVRSHERAQAHKTAGEK